MRPFVETRQVCAVWPWNHTGIEPSSETLPLINGAEWLIMRPELKTLITNNSVVS